MRLPCTVGRYGLNGVEPIALLFLADPVRITAAFKDNLPVAALLGMNDFFEHFIVPFDHSAFACEIERIHFA